MIFIRDLTPQSGINWTKPILEIDRQLYKKYSLTPEEQSLIERMIKPDGVKQQKPAIHYGRQAF